MRLPKPARWAVGLVLVVAALKGGCEIGEEIAERCCHPNQDHEFTTRVSSTQSVISQVGRSSRAYAGEPREMASAFLREKYLSFGLKQSLDDLNIINARANTFSTNVEFQQVFNGLPVENARLQVNFDKGGYVVHVVNSYTRPVNTSDQVTLSKEQTINIARQEFSRTTPIYVSKVDEQEQARAVYVDPKDIKLAEPEKVDDVYFVRKDQLRRAYKTYIRAVNPFGVKEVVTDANSGEVLRIRDFVFNAVDGHGQVFIPNPVNTLNNDGLRDSEDSNGAIPAGGPTPYVTVLLRDLDLLPGAPLRLKGPYVVLEDIEAPDNTPLTTASATDFIYERDSDNFEEVMVYYHIDRMQRYIQAPPLGFMNIMNRQIRADAHACDGRDNSRYVSSPEDRGNGYLLFGDGGVDDAEDADVIAHEYGHAIQDNQTFGKYEVNSAETRAMAEGFGDYWALSTYKTESDKSGYNFRFLMEWDHPPNLRKVELFQTRNAFIPPEPPDPRNAGNPHLNGLIWSSTLLEILNTLGKETADRLILQSHFNVPDGPNFEQGADAIIAADLELFQGNHNSALCLVFQHHKIYKEHGCPSAPPQ